MSNFSAVFFAGFLLIVSAYAKTEIKSVKYPHVVTFRGGVELKTSKDLKLRKPKYKEILRENATFKTTDKGQIEIALDERRSVEVLPHSEVEFPNISWESGDIDSVHIKTGEIFWQQSSANGHPVKIRSALFDFTPPVSQLKVAYDSGKIYSEVKVYSGHLEFAAMNSENSVLLIAGKQVGYQGVREDNEVAYDVLLKGRKIPKGVLGKVHDIPSAEMQHYSVEALEQKKLADQKRIQAENAKKNVLLPGQVCRAPNGKLNECAWLCLKNPKGTGSCLISKQGVSCVRRRCNANGVWGEETTLEAGEGSLKCKSSPQVAPCDY